MFPNAVIEIGNYKLYWYGILIGIGIVLAFIVLFLYGKKKNIESRYLDFIFYTGIATIGVGFLSAAVFQETYNFIEDPSRGWNPFRSDGIGITFIGGLIGGAIFFLLIAFLFRKKYKNTLFDILSIAPCCILIAHGMGRIGCFFAGCCYGAPTDSLFGVVFPAGHPTHGVKVHPAQLYEAAFLFILFAVCTVMFFKFNSVHNMSLYLFSYGIFRFLIEYLRDDARGELVGKITPSQFWSLLMVAGSIGLYFLERHLKKKRDTKAVQEV